MPTSTTAATSRCWSGTASAARCCTHGQTAALAAHRAAGQRPPAGGGRRATPTERLLQARPAAAAVRRGRRRAGPCALLTPAGIRALRRRSPGGEVHAAPGRPHPGLRRRPSSPSTDARSCSAATSAAPDHPLLRPPAPRRRPTSSWSSRRTATGSTRTDDDRRLGEAVTPHRPPRRLGAGPRVRASTAPRWCCSRCSGCVGPGRSRLCRSSSTARWRWPRSTSTGARSPSGPDRPAPGPAGRPVRAPDACTWPGRRGVERAQPPGTPCIIVSASGMATGGRVVHHLGASCRDRATPWCSSGSRRRAPAAATSRRGATQVKMPAATSRSAPRSRSSRACRCTPTRTSCSSGCAGTAGRAAAEGLLRRARRAGRGPAPGRPGAQ